MRPFGELFHDGIVDGIRRAGGKSVGVDTHEVGFLDARIERGTASGSHDRIEFVQRLEPDTGAHHEKTAVPQVFARGDVLLGKCETGLFDEGHQLERVVVPASAGTDIAVARLGARRDDPKGDDGTVPGRLQSGGDRRVEGLAVGDDVIRRHHEEDRIAAVPCGELRGQRKCGSGVASDRLEDDAGTIVTRRAQLLRDHETVRAIANDDGRRDTLSTCVEAVEAADGFLQHGVQAGERKELFGLVFAGERPQTGAGAAGQDDGSKHREINKYREYR